MNGKNLKEESSIVIAWNYKISDKEGKILTRCTKWGKEFNKIIWFSVKVDDRIFNFWLISLTD